MKKDFKQEVIQVLGITSLPEAEQDTILAKVELIANTRLATALPELLSDDVYKQVETRRAAGEDETTILDWVEDQIPHYDEMIRAMILDVADEVSKDLK